MKRTGTRAWSDRRGAVAPTVALSLFVLIGAGGIAFDYARLAGMDTELQSAADQAALAAATQLDRQAGAIARATAAARGLITNDTRFANESGTMSAAVAIFDVRFYETKAHAEAHNGTLCPTANTVSTDAQARFVCVQTATRVANYALTPVVNAFSSGNMSAMAVAGLGSAICKVPPLMMCNPAETGTSTAFDPALYVGKGIRLVAGGSGGGWAPGNFGYLETDLGPGANTLEYALGANSPPGNCLSADAVTTKPGLQTSVTDAINTRFDIYENGLVNDCTGAACSPGMNNRKDVVHADFAAINGNANCGYKTGNDPWDLPPVNYLPDPATRAQAAALGTPTNMGLPRDICHSVSQDGDCAAGRIGDGSWDRALYFKVHHQALFPSTASWKTAAGLQSWATGKGINLDNITRYQVYLWEIETNQLAARTAYSTTQGANTTNYLSYAQARCSTGVPATATQLDRRLTSVAVINCLAEGLAGQTKGVVPVTFLEVFFTEPSIARSRTVAADIYIEVVRETTAGGNGSTAGQVIRRDTPYLVK